MAFELLLETGSISNEGANLEVNDASIWADSDEGARGSYGVFVLAQYRISSTPVAVAVTPVTPLTDVTWGIVTGSDGRYTFNSYAFLTVAATTAPVSGDVAVDTDDLLKMYNGATWDVVDLADHLDDAVYVGVLEVPYLAYAYTYKNQLNLEYIAQVKGDIVNGAEQNKLYYKRTDLDYFAALIDGAGYNWALGLYSNYYAIVNNLDDIRENQQIS
jgi:hypothetical protein